MCHVKHASSAISTVLWKLLYFKVYFINAHFNGGGKRFSKLFTSFIFMKLKSKQNFNFLNKENNYN